ncbi:putative lipid II flippase FtsW [Agreia pratensis]|uniref:Probable peptidoglycan glycosyltransferase FtsW n=1 Tax=Agreia pratensis TaxID=150121 RepID=A0A1X7L817_9MICO|nr:putative lipid II flippase FtsW [Agreia pratensis]MBF4633996.1 putative lipid II flippase FtsW [Agreia pratensis]SMG49402.1 cell division-specific peptidoglycan biosynthesis regulator FtsW [Agreia pratensis]
MLPGSNSKNRATSTSAGQAARTARISLGRAFQPESRSYFLLLGTTMFLMLFGLVMVLSASSVSSYAGSQGAFGVFWRQAIFAAVGVPLMLILAQTPVRVWRRFAWVPLVAGIFLQILVLYTPLGIEAGGNRNWIGIGGFNAQPSELIKLGLVAWLGVILSKKEPYLNRFGHVLIPAVPVAGLGIFVVLLGGDMGTAMIMAALVFGALFFAGIKVRMLVIPVAVALALTVVIVLTRSSRIERIQNFLGIGGGDQTGLSYQNQHADWAMAAGGVFGVGLGNSKAKWLWLPAADNDFIFAIIGEELGLVGAVVVLALFVVLAISFLRIVRSSTELFSRVVTGSVMVWVIGQAFVNIAVVLQVLPVLGVPLPLISSGGSALVTSLLAVGMVLSIARHNSRSGDDLSEKTIR